MAQPRIAEWLEANREHHEIGCAEDTRKRSGDRCASKLSFSDCFRIAPHTGNPAYLLLRQIIEPIMSPFRRLLPDMSGIDLSPILAFLSIKVVQIILSAAAVFVSLSPSYYPLVLGI